MKLIVFLFFFLALIAGNLTAQPPVIRVDAAGLSLNKVLLELSEKYGIQLVFDDFLLSQFKISSMREYHSVDEALSSILKGKPLTVKKAGDVYMIVPEMSEKPARKLSIRVSGKVMEKDTYEPLPYSNIVINNKQIQSDQSGTFTFLASADTSYKMQISHLGYFLYDTAFSTSFSKSFFLKPSVKQIREITVLGNPVEESALIGDEAGKMKLNHMVSPYLPGYGDNPVYNLLRLMPGITAAGEQSAELLIWGGYESHSKVELDGFTLFGLKNYNDNIGAVNPLVLKSMEVYKGGYEAKYGDRVGGIVQITSKNGSLQKPGFTFNINNTTLNSLLEVPLSDKSSLLAAYRQTYYELYDPAELNLFNGRNGNPDGVDFTFIPDYTFRDANLKYSYNGEGNSVGISIYGGGDRYAYNLENEVGNITLLRDEEENNRQYGGSANLSHKWMNGNTSSLTLGFSTLRSTSEEQNKTVNNKNQFERIRKDGNGENNVGQITVSQENRFNFRNGKYLETGMAFQSNNVLLQRELSSEMLIDMETRSNRLFSYAQLNVPVKSFLEINTGIRFSYLFQPSSFFADPKISAKVRVGEKVNFNAAWGIYHQFLAKTSLVDSSKNFYYYWANPDGVDIPVLSAEHCVAGLTYKNKGFTASVEGYYKTTNGLSRFFSGVPILPKGFYMGENRSYGMDIFIRKEYKRHVAWISYSLGKSEELFPFYRHQEYRPSPQDQRHEIKMAGILNFKSFYFSASYVYGSGFEKFLLTNSEGEKYIPAYKRLDVATIYKFKPGKINAEAGISVLNILNTKNIKLSNLRRVATGTENQLDILAEAVPFTPTLFLKIKL